MKTPSKLASSMVVAGALFLGCRPKELPQEPQANLEPAMTEIDPTELTEEALDQSEITPAEHQKAALDARNFISCALERPDLILTGSWTGRNDDWRYCTSPLNDRMEWDRCAKHYIQPKNDPNKPWVNAKIFERFDGQFDLAVDSMDSGLHGTYPVMDLNADGNGDFSYQWDTEEKKLLDNAAQRETHALLAYLATECRSLVDIAMLEDKLAKCMMGLPEDVPGLEISNYPMLYRAKGEENRYLVRKAPNGQYISMQVEHDQTHKDRVLVWNNHNYIGDDPEWPEDHSKLTMALEMCERAGKEENNKGKFFYRGQMNQE